jgi:hypothetical protein
MRVDTFEIIFKGFDEYLGIGEVGSLILSIALDDELYFLIQLLQGELGFGINH